MSFLAMGVEAVERGLVPDSWTRLAISRLCRQRLMEFEGAASEQAMDRGVLGVASQGADRACSRKGK